MENLNIFYSLVMAGYSIRAIVPELQMFTFWNKEKVYELRYHTESNLDGHLGWWVYDFGNEQGFQFWPVLEFFSSHNIKAQSNDKI